jgi:hypothetical protein
MRTLLLVGLVCLIACDAPDGQPAPTVPDGRATPDSAADVAPPLDAALLDAALLDALPTSDFQVPADATVDAAPDAAPPPVTCEEVCQRYDACGDPFLTLGGCAGYCPRIVAGWPRWSVCVANAEDCDALTACELPEVAPRSCEAICGRSDQCDTPIADCEARCEEAPDVFRACTHAQRTRCDLEPDLEACLAAWPRCGGIWSACRQCSEGRDCQEVLAACMAEVDPPDPLARARVEDRRACLAGVGNCADRQRCERILVPGVSDALDQCWEEEPPIRFDYEYFAENPEANACMAAYLEIDGWPCDNVAAAQSVVNRCANEAFLAECRRLCRAGAVCGRLPDGAADEAACLSQCLESVGDERERIDATRTCAEATTCAAWDECLDRHDPLVECVQLCGRLDACGTAGPDCVATCHAEWPRSRHAAWRTCLAQAVDCEGISACVLAEPPPLCPAWCDRMAECNRHEAGDGCVAACDDQTFDRHFLESLHRQVCGISAASCDLINTCGGDQPAKARACLGWCRAESGCADLESLVPCLRACGEGPAGLDLVAFRQDYECLAEAALEGTCEDVLACRTPPPDCMALCGAADACGVGDPDCLAHCAADPLWRDHRRRAGEACAALDDCAAVETCFAGPPMAGPVAQCRYLCDARFVCQGVAANCNACFVGPDPRIVPSLVCAAADTCAELDTCLEHNSPEAFCRQHCDLLSACGAEPAECRAECDRRFSRLDMVAWRACVAEAPDCAARLACPEPVPMPCAEFCAAERDIRPECVPECEDRAFLAPEFWAGVLACIREHPWVEVPRLDRCWDPDPLCARFCRATTTCEGEGADLYPCVFACEAGFVDARGLALAASTACLQDLQPEAACDLLTECSLPEPAIDCAALCGAVDACQLPGFNCAAHCAAATPDEAGCVAAAASTDEPCAHIARCVGQPLPPVEPACAQLCGLRNACDTSIDSRVCALECPADPLALAAQLACQGALACWQDVACPAFAGPSPACQAACAARAACGDADVCAAACTGLTESGERGADWIDDLTQCAAAADCNTDCAAQVWCGEPLPTLRGEGVLLLQGEVLEFAVALERPSLVEVRFESAESITLEVGWNRCDTTDYFLDQCCGGSTETFVSGPGTLYFVLYRLDLGIFEGSVTVQPWPLP